MYMLISPVIVINILYMCTACLATPPPPAHPCDLDSVQKVA
eukprot:COSAG01_NODE_26604_length_708_cov_1.528736_1_plen_40_part_10